MVASIKRKWQPRYHIVQVCTRLYKVGIWLYMVAYKAGNINATMSQLRLLSFSFGLVAVHCVLAFTAVADSQCLYNYTGLSDLFRCWFLR